MDNNSFIGAFVTQLGLLAVFGTVGIFILYGLTHAPLQLIGIFILAFIIGRIFKS